MSDWRFASISGYLTWTTPSVPDGGVELFSELSPTLIIALQEQGDTLPVDYIKLLSITSVALPPGSRGIELTREGAPPVLLVAGTPDNANEWYTMIQTAIGDSALSSRIKPRPTQPAAVAAPADAPTSAVDIVAAGSSTGSIPRPRAASTGSHQSLGIQSAFPPAAQSGAAASGPTSRQGSDTGSLRLQLPPQSAGSQQPQQASSSLTQPPPRVQLPTSQPPPWVQAAMAASTSSSGQQQQQPPQTAHNAPRASSTFDSDPRSISHSFKPLSEITGVPARTTTTTTYVDHNRPASKTPSASGVGSLAFSAAQPGSHVAAGPASNRWEPSNAVQSSWTPLAARASLPSASAAQASPAPQPQAQQSSFMNFPSRPLPPQPQSVSPIVHDDRGASTEGPRYDDLPAMHQSSLGYRKRSGMLVDVPPNPQVNRNNAPNVSAIWKEWSGPDGVLYVCHEPTGTLQRRNPETGEFETLVDGTQEIHPEDMALHPYTGQETAVDVNNSVMKNVDRYGGARGVVNGMQGMSMSSPSVYRAAPVMSPRGQYSPTRRSQLSSLAPPRQNQSTYNGRRVHHLTLGPDEEAGEAIEHKIQLLGGSGLRWDPQSGKVVAPETANPGDVGTSTLHRQWEHVRKILMQGRYFRKHALRTSTASFRYAFLTSDNAYVVCVPTSEVLFNVNEKPKTFQSMTETVQYYGPESRAIALNTITHVSLGTEEQFVRNRSSTLAPENTFCIVSRTHAFILECNTSEEAKYFADAWTFFLYHSKPTNTAKQRTQQVKNPVTFGTRGGIAF